MLPENLGVLGQWANGSKSSSHTSIQCGVVLPIIRHSGHLDWAFMKPSAVDHRKACKKREINDDNKIFNHGYGSRDMWVIRPLVYSTRGIQTLIRICIVLCRNTVSPKLQMWRKWWYAIELCVPVPYSRQTQKPMDWCLQYACTTSQPVGFVWKLWQNCIP